MKLIVACDPKGGIGYNNKLPWSNIKGDLPRFKALTDYQNIVMGRNTWESLPRKPLPNRANYVVTTSTADIDGAFVIRNIAFLDIIPDAWLIGGATLIESCWSKLTEIHLTKTFAEYTCDTFIDLVKLQNEFICRSKEDHTDHTYEIWKRK